MKEFLKPKYRRIPKPDGSWLDDNGELVVLTPYWRGMIDAGLVVKVDLAA